jgi:hypothetical protein
MAGSVAGHIMRRLTENLYMLKVLAPVAVADGIYPSSSAYIDVSKYGRFCFIIDVGVTDDTAVTAQVLQATAAAGTGSKVVTGAAITGTLLAGTNDGKWAVIEVETSRLDIANGFRYVAIDVAATGGASTIMAIKFFGWRMDRLPPTYGTDKAEIVYVDG